MKNLKLLVCFCVLTFSACQEVNVVTEMQRFDESFIPVWVAARSGNPNSIELTIDKLREEWESLKNEYELEIEPTTDWLDTYECLDDLMNQTTLALEQKNMLSALEHLDGIRFELINLRSRYGIDYELDSVWEFEMAYSLVKSLLQDQAYFRMEWQEFDCVVEDMNQAWETLLESNPEKNLSDDRKTTFRKHQKEIATYLKQFSDVVEKTSAESEVISYNLAVVEQPLLQIIQLFGS
ncbi:MAG: hypothetical protein HC892_04395 [Saprospiraceae bacterium]|nr:hypothetical protein [Saprospiraceae bacterium]